MKVVKPIFSKLLNYLAALIMLQCAVAGSLSGQDYKSVLVPMEVNPNASNLVMEEDEFVVRSLNAIGIETGTSILRLNTSLQLIDQVDIPNSFFSEDSPILVGNSYYALELDLRMPASHLFVKYDREFNELSKSSLISNNGTTSVLSLLKQNDGFIASVWNRSESAKAKIHLFGLEESGAETFNIIQDQQEPYLFSYELSAMADQSVLFGTNLYSQGSFAGVYKLDGQGETIWKYKSPDKQSRGNVPVYVTELSNGKIVYTDKVERLELWPEYNDRPARIGWLSSEGDSLTEHIVLVPRNDIVELYGIKAGLNGDYFYFYGSRDYEGVDYGFIVKMTNEGEVLWEKRYAHLGLVEDNYIIRDIEELSSGDIVTLGQKSIVGGKKDIWMMRLNEHGCFGTEMCSDEPLYVSTTELETERMLLHPNPTEGIVYLQNINLTKIRQIVLTDASGARQLVLESGDLGPFIDVSRLSAGSYFVSIHMQDGQVVTERVVKM